MRLGIPPEGKAQQLLQVYGYTMAEFTARTSINTLEMTVDYDDPESFGSLQYWKEVYNYIESARDQSETGSK